MLVIAEVMILASAWVFVTEPQVRNVWNKEEPQIVASQCC